MTSSSSATIPLTPVHLASAARHEAPYRAFIGASLALGIGGGFLLGLLLPLSRALEWGWGSGDRYPALVQAHGQLQLMGFGGLFIMGMALRLLPRIAARELAFASLAPWMLAAVVTSLVLRALAEPAPDTIVRDGTLIASAALLLAAAGVFTAIVVGTALGRGSQAGSTAIFFTLGSIGYAAGAILNALQIIDVVHQGLAVASPSKETAMVFTQQYGFTVMFISGIASRMIPAFTGHKRREITSTIAAGILSVGIAMFAGGTEWAAYRGGSEMNARIGDAGLVLTAVAFALLVWASGALESSPNRVAAASQTQFLFVRAAMCWMLAAAALTLWYAVRALMHGSYADQFELDAIRHALTIGVLTMMIMGIGMLIVPEFAGRRLQHPNEHRLVMAMLIALNASVAFRIWPAIEGIDWLAHTRYWPMAVAGIAVEAVVVVFGAMFVQSYFEQRRQGWARNAKRPATSGSDAEPE